MSGNCLLVISKNEGINPLSIAKQALESDLVDKVIISDGSNEETFKRLKQGENKKIQVLNERKYVKTKEIGKGIGMINAGIAAIKQNFDNVAFIDGDILNPNINKWFEFLFPPLESDIDIVKTSFLRNPADGQITRHITKPLIAMFFPPAWEIGQPLGGELSITTKALNDILNKGLTPPYGWGIDTFITIKSLIYGYKMGEVYLGQKMHNKKTLTNLKKMFDQCFMESMRIIEYNKKLPYKKKINPIIEITTPFQKNANFDETYMDIKKEVNRSINQFKLMKNLNLPHDETFYDMKNVNSFEDFFEKSKKINVNIWVELLYWFAKKYQPELIDQYYYRWKIRALSFCLHEINTVEQAENRTMIQAKTASDFAQKIDKNLSFSNQSEKAFYYTRKK